MIPVVVNGQQQTFNDGTTNAEKINRGLLDTLVFAQQKLTNLQTACNFKIGKEEYTEAQLATLVGAVQTLNAAVKGAVATFEAAM